MLIPTAHQSMGGGGWGGWGEGRGWDKLRTPPVQAIITIKDDFKLLSIFDQL